MRYFCFLSLFVSKYACTAHQTHTKQTKVVEKQPFMLIHNKRINSRASLCLWGCLRRAQGEICIFFSIEGEKENENREEKKR